MKLFLAKDEVQPVTSQEDFHLTKIGWGITGAGHLLIESVEVMSQLASKPAIELTTFLSKAGVECAQMYGVWEKIEKISARVYSDIRASAPEVGGLARGRYKVLVISPSTANTVAKVVAGIADTLVTNAVAQAQKAKTPVVLVPTDQAFGPILTRLPHKMRKGSDNSLSSSSDISYGEEIQIAIRRVDTDNFEKLKKMEGMTVLDHPYKILDTVKSYLD
jgi:dihydromethanopterin reductase (acceptor)